ncbi:hypothetical protein [Micromonospora sp. NPDC023814]|uniref:hypothetical protein n=1 Tax=Micromonospora sp. NPDC023814 TaxID=3154596 RepID=UPI0033D4C29F
MANKMLGKVVAGAALGGASLLVFTPGIAFADGHHDEGKVYAKPHVVKAGDTVKLLEVCSERQEHAYVWSKVTGKVNLKPAEDRDDWRGEKGSGDRDKGKDHEGRDHDKGKDHEGKDHEGKDHDKGKDHEGKDHEGKDHDKGKDHEGKDETAKPQPSTAGGQGGGAADDGERDWKGYEHGQDAEGDRGGREGEDRKDHDKYGSDSGGSDRGDSGREEDRKDHEGYGSDEGDRKKDHEKKDWSDEESRKDDKDKDRWEHKRDFVYYGEAEVSEDAKPGRYELKGSCGEGELVVLPRGGVDGGDGGAGAGTDRRLAAGGASLLGAAALGGLVLMRRRRTDESLV